MNGQHLEIVTNVSKIKHSDIAAYTKELKQCPLSHQNSLDAGQHLPEVFWAKDEGKGFGRR